MGLQARAAHWAQVWGCTPDGAAIETAGALLWPCRRAGAAVMLKVLAPGSDEGGQAALLAAWRGRGAVRLLQDAEDALVMERVLHQGPSLAQMALAGQDEAALRLLCAGADLLRGVVVPGLQPLDQRMRDLDAFPDWPLARWASGLRDEMLADRSGWTGLHGDLHHFNLLHDAARGWLAIDPKGVLGPPVYDLVNSLLNPFPHQAHVCDPARMGRLAAVVGEHLGLTAQEVLVWTCLHGCLAASWDGAEGYWSAAARVAGRLAGLRPA